MITARAFLQALRGGSSLPMVFATDDGRRYVVRMRGAGDGALGLIVDWLGLGIARLLDLPAPTPTLLRLPAGLPLANIDPEHRELIERSIGINLATPFADDASPLLIADVASCDVDVRRRIFLLDVLLMNIDRTRANPNLLLIGGQLSVQDFDSAMALRLLVTGSAAVAEQDCLRELRRHVLFDPAFLDAGAEPLPQVGSDALADLLRSVPQSWWDALPQRSGAAIDPLNLGEGLQQLVNARGTLQARLAALASLPEVSEAALRARRHANAQAFRDRIQR